MTEPVGPVSRARPRGDAPSGEPSRSGASRLVALGAIARPHGVRGELRVHRFNPDSELLLDAPTVFLRRGEVVEERVVRDARMHHDVLLVTLEGVSGREGAEALRGSEVCLPREAFPPLEEGEHYHVDLLGLRALGEGDAELGVVEDVIVYPTVDVLLVRRAAGAVEVPMVDPYLVEIDVSRGFVRLAHLEDLDPRS